MVTKPKERKVIAIRPNEKEQAIIDKYIKDHNLRKPSEALKHMVNAIPSLLQQKLEQTPKVASRYLPESMKSEFPYALQEELNRFLRGQGIDRNGNVTCPTIEAILGLNPNSEIKIILP